MKNVIIISLTILSFFSCVRESEMYQRQYSLKNESGQIVKLKFYLKYSNQLIFEEEIILSNNDVFNAENLEFSKPLSNNVDYLVNTAYRASDSLIVVYDNQKKSTYTVDFYGSFSTPLNRNLFRHGNYEYLGNDQFQFTFTEEDYENAEDCGGPCE